MVFRLNLKLALFALLFAATLPAFSQIAPAAQERHIPIAVGVGVSDFSLDWGEGRRMEGITAWVDLGIPHTPHFLNGLGIELEGRDINWGRPSSTPTMRHDTAVGGPIYSIRRFGRFQPYAKYLIGIGSIDFPRLPGSFPSYRHDTRTVYAPGGGADYRVYKKIWVRADYEYQFWPNLFGAHSLNPNGVTFGALYDFGRRR